MAGVAHYSTRPPVPLDALKLGDDIMALRICRAQLEEVDHRNITEDADTGWKIIHCLRHQLQLCQRYAENKMRKEYLAPSKKRMNANKPRIVSPS